MPDPKGHRLYVNLSPSQVRKRLKGFGHGVRKVHSAGKNRAVIIHTATGQHLVELAAVFADVGCSPFEHGPPPSGQAAEREPTETLPNRDEGGGSGR